MRAILTKWITRFLKGPEVVKETIYYPKEVEVIREVIKDKIVVLDHKPLSQEEYVMAFVLDDTHPFLRALYQLCDTMRDDYMAQATDPKSTPECKLDSVARMSAIDELKRNIIAQKITTQAEIKRRNP